MRVARTHRMAVMVGIALVAGVTTVIAFGRAGGVLPGGCQPAVTATPLPTDGDRGGQTVERVMPGQELGNLFVGFGCADWEYGRHPGQKFAISFLAHSSKSLDRMWICWMSSGLYGSGTLGVWSFELQTDNPDGHVPSGTVLSRADGLRNPPSGYCRIDLPPVRITAGSIYHLVMYNTDPLPARNWSSPNTIISVPDRPWRGIGTMHFDGRTWKPWGTRVNPLYPGEGSRAAYLLHFTDGSTEGMPYYGARRRRIFAGNAEGELIRWQGPDAPIGEVGFSVFRIGRPPTALSYTVEEVGAGTLSRGTLVNADAATTVPGWVRVPLASSCTLRRGKTYRLYLSADGCPAETDCYGTYVVYGTDEVPGWEAQTWGGAASVSISRVDGTWEEATVPADLSFSLVVAAVR